MDRHYRYRLVLLLFGFGLTVATGCSYLHSRRQADRPCHRDDTRVIASMASVRLQKPACVDQPNPDLLHMSAQPLSTRHGDVDEFWPLSLDEVVRMGLANSDILRDLGGQVVHSPETTPSRYQIATTSTDPRFGVQAALSAFDAQFQNRLFFQNNDRVFNNETAGLGVNEFQQDIFGVESGITKRTATGAQFSLLHRTDYDANNSTTNLFPSAWNTQLNATVRVPLLRGAGTTFNRIAGPNAQPGFFLAQGVLLARVNEDISAADFEAGVIQFVDDIETTYWELYFAYRNLDVVGTAREATAIVLDEVTEAVQVGADEGFRQLSAEVQMHALDDQYQNALAGSAVADLSVGVYRGERKLRYLIGLPPTDGRLIRPADHPSDAELTFDWQTAAAEAINRRVELRRQQWQIKKKQLELTGSRNFTLPQLDVFSTYRIRGFGDDLAGGGRGRFQNAYDNFGTLDYQELEGGVEFSMPAGFRQGWSAVRNAKLQLSRAQAVLQTQSEQVLSELSDAVAEVDRAHTAAEINYRRLLTARAYQESIQLSWENDGPVSIESRLDAINQVAVAEGQYYRALVDQALAIKNVHAAKGSLLQTNGVLLSETAWPCGAGVAQCSAAGDWFHRSCGEPVNCPGVLAGEEVDPLAQYATPEINGAFIAEPEMLDIDYSAPTISN